MLLTDEKTSARLGRVRQSDTDPELVVRRLLHQLGARYRARARELPGSPDISNRSKRWVIFVHGCFWHRHEGCSRATTPKRNGEFWRAKFDANVARDARAIVELTRRKFDTLVIWECDTRDVAKLQKKLRDFLSLNEKKRASGGAGTRARVNAGRLRNAGPGRQSRSR
ncbi:very short patch repair endonuclease [soil metagenome]